MGNNLLKWLLHGDFWNCHLHFLIELDRFEYGRALLMKEQDNPSDDLLGAMAAEAKKQAQALGDDLSVE